MTLHLSGTLLRFSNYKKDFDVQGATVGDALAALVAQCPSLKPVLFDDAGQFRQAYRLFVNAHQLEDDMQRKLAPTDDVEIVTAIAGG